MSNLFFFFWFKNEQIFGNIDGATKVCMAMGHYIGRTRLENLQRRGNKTLPGN